MQGVTVPARSLFGMRRIEHPFFQADRVDHQCVSFPLADRVAHPGQFLILAMRPAICGDRTKEMHVLVKDHHLTRRLDPLLCVGRDDLSRKTVRKANRSRVILKHVPRERMIHQGLSARLERRHFLRIVRCDLWGVGIIGSDFVAESGSCPDPGKVGFAIRRARHCLTRQCRLCSTGRLCQRHHGNHDSHRYEPYCKTRSHVGISLQYDCHPTLLIDERN